MAEGVADKTPSLLGIIIAMPTEARSFSSTFKHIGTIYPLGSRAFVAVSGMGELAAEAAKALRQRQVSCLISCGTAVGLAPDLNPGALCIPEKVVHEHGQSYDSDAFWRQQLLTHLDDRMYYREEPLAHAATILRTGNEKQLLFQQTGAIAADMESFIIAQQAQQMNVPFFAIRTIIDKAQFNMPEALMSCFSPSGEVFLSKIIIHLCRQPKMLFPLLSLARGFSQARTTLKKIAQMEFFE